MFLDTLLRHCADLGDKTAVAFIGGPRRSYGELGDDVRRCARFLLDIGIQPGDRVAAQLPKCLPFITLHLATMRIGAIFLPLNPAYPAAETRYFLGDSGAGVLFTDAGKRGLIDTIAADLPDLKTTYFLDDDAFDELISEGESTALPDLPSDPKSDGDDAVYQRHHQPAKRRADHAWQFDREYRGAARGMGLAGG